jgi:hypothetical protein
VNVVQKTTCAAADMHAAMMIFKKPKQRELCLERDQNHKLSISIWQLQRTIRTAPSKAFNTKLQSRSKPISCGFCSDSEQNPHQDQELKVSSLTYTRVMRMALTGGICWALLFLVGSRRICKDSAQNLFDDPTVGVRKVRSTINRLEPGRICKWVTAALDDPRRGGSRLKRKFWFWTLDL